MRRRRIHTVAATILAVLWLVVPVVTAVHAATDEHTYCTAHAAIEERSGNADTRQAEPSAADTLAAERVDDGHGRCGLDDAVTADAFHDHQALIEVPFTTAEPVQALARATVAHPVPLLLLAPKSSPPIA